MIRSDPTGMSVRFVDLPDLPETFADSIQGFAYDGSTLRRRLQRYPPGRSQAGRHSERTPVSVLPVGPDAGRRTGNAQQPPRSEAAAIAHR